MVDGTGFNEEKRRETIEEANKEVNKLIEEIWEK